MYIYYTFKIFLNLFSPQSVKSYSYIFVTNLVCENSRAITNEVNVFWR